MTCLVTKLKSPVNSPGLFKIGEIAITVTDATNFKINNNTYKTIRADESVLYHLDSSGNKAGTPFKEGVLYNNDQSLGDVFTYGVGVASGYDGKVYVNFENTALDVTLNGGAADFSKLTYARSFRSENTENGTQITGFPEVSHEIYIAKVPTGSVVNLDSFINIRDEYVTFLSVSPSPGTAEINVGSLLVNKPNITILYVVNSLYTNMSAESMADFGKLVNLTSITHNPRYSWTVENFVANKRSVGVTSGSVTIRYGGDDSAGGVCSFNGQKMDSSVTEVTWTANTITYNGVTINA